MTNGNCTEIKMSLINNIKRKAVHERNIQCKGYLREDGLWDIEAHLTDEKMHNMHSVERGEIPAGEKIHDMWLRLTVDETLLIHHAEASTEMAPYSICSGVNPWYQKLEGKKIAPGWNLMVKKLFIGVNGCTHLTELLGVIATVAIQTIFPYLNMQEMDTNTPRKLTPGLANSCHGYNTNGEIIARFWPESAQKIPN
jgi:hypothetical protein